MAYKLTLPPPLLHLLLLESSEFHVHNTSLRVTETLFPFPSFPLSPLSVPSPSCPVAKLGSTNCNSPNTGPGYLQQRKLREFRVIVTIMSDQGDNMAMDDIKQSLSIIDPHSSSFDKEAALRHAKEKGWTEPVPYNYSTTGAQDAAEDAFTHPEAAWLSDAVRYEWSDEYGEVGPANPDLEQKLFYSEKSVKAGALIKAYEFEVTLEGPIHIHPVRDVCFLVKLWLALTNAILV